MAGLVLLAGTAKAHLERSNIDAGAISYVGWPNCVLEEVGGFWLLCVATGMLALLIYECISKACSRSNAPEGAELETALRRTRQSLGSAALIVLCWHGLAQARPGALIEKQSYMADVYALVYSSKLGSANRKVAVRIERYGEGHYAIREIYFTPGRATNVEPEDLYLGERVPVRVSSGAKTYYVELTSQLAPKQDTK